MDKRLEAIEKWLSEVSFKKKLFGGVDEVDLWMKIEKLNGLYEEALIAERVRCDSLLEKKEK